MASLQKLAIVFLPEYILKMTVKLLAHTPDPESLIAYCGATCYDSIPKEVDSARVMIRGFIKSGHESVIEHATVTFEFSDVSRVLTHELVRHRLFSFSQRSQRYVNEKVPQFVTPEEIEENPEALEVYNVAMINAWDVYSKLQKLGLKNEMARYILPNACSTKICVSGNFRQWRNFLILRLSKRAQHEIRNMAFIVLDKLIEIAPSCFEDLKAEENLQNT